MRPEDRRAGTERRQRSRELDHLIEAARSRGPSDIWLYRAATAPVGVIALLGIFSALSFWLDPGYPERTAIGRSLEGVIDDLWNAMYLGGGLLILLGVWTARAGIEFAGHTPFVTAVLVNTAAALSVAGGFNVTIALSFSVAVGLSARMWYLWWLSPLVGGKEAVLEVPEPPENRDP